MTTQKERNETHWKKKAILKREIDAVYYEEPFDEVYIRVSFGYGKEAEVTMASHKYCQDMADVLTLVGAYESERYIELKEEMEGFIGKPTYKLIKDIMEFHVINDDLREEVGYLLDEENWSELEKIFGGN